MDPPERRVAALGAGFRSRSGAHRGGDRGHGQAGAPQPSQSFGAPVRRLVEMAVSARAPWLKLGAHHCSAAPRDRPPDRRKPELPSGDFGCCRPCVRGRCSGCQRSHWADGRRVSLRSPFKIEELLDERFVP